MATTRPRGFIDNYRPTAKTQALLAQVASVFQRLGKAITLRQLFYRLIAWCNHDKTEKFYKNQVIEVMNMARRAKLVSMDAIVDHGEYLTNEWYFDDTEEFVEHVNYLADNFELDRQAGQDRRILLWCEAAGMISQLEEIGRPYSAKVSSKGGFDSVTAKHQAGKQLTQEPITVLHCGDLDPSGEHMFSALDEDVRAFADYYGGDIRFERIAVTPEQVVELGLSAKPREFNAKTGKLKDNRRYDLDYTVQLEAIDPNDLERIVRDAIESRLDMGLYQMILKQEIRERQEAKGLLV